MMRSFLLAVAVLAMAAPPGAHHSDTNYELSKEITVTGVVTEFLFRNPHMQVTFEVADSGTVSTWIAQGTSPNMLVHRGWNSSTLQPGHTITVVGHRARNGATAMRVSRIFLDGKEIYR